MSRARPHLAVGHKDTIAQKLLPVAMKRLAFSIVGKLAREDGFDVLRLCCENDSG